MPARSKPGAVLKFPTRSPHPPEITELVQDIARDTYHLEDESMKVFYFVDDDGQGLSWFARDTLHEDRTFTAWFPEYLEQNRSWWDKAELIVYSDTIDEGNQIRYHVVVGPDTPVYALCVNKETGESVWYLQETPVAEMLSRAKAR